MSATYSALSFLRSSSGIVSSVSESPPPSSWARAAVTRPETFIYRLANLRIPLARSSVVGLSRPRRFQTPNLRTSWSYFHFDALKASWVTVPSLPVGELAGELCADMSEFWRKVLFSGSGCLRFISILQVTFESSGDILDFSRNIHRYGNE